MRGVTVDIGEHATGTTDREGRATFEALPVGEHVVTLDGTQGPVLSVETRDELSVLLIATDGAQAAAFSGFPRTYALEGREPLVFRPGDDPALLDDAASTAGTIIDVRDGVYLDRGRLSLGEGVTAIGPAMSGGEAWLAAAEAGPQSTLAGFAIGEVPTGGPDATLAHNRVLGDSRLVVWAGSYWMNTFCGSIQLLEPIEDDAVLLGNQGLPPLSAPDERCAMPSP